MQILRGALQKVGNVEVTTLLRLGEVFSSLVGARTE